MCVQVSLLNQLDADAFRAGFFFFFPPFMMCSVGLMVLLRLSDFKVQNEP